MCLSKVLDIILVFKHTMCAYLKKKSVGLFFGLMLVLFFMWVGLKKDIYLQHAFSMFSSWKVVLAFFKSTTFRQVDCSS